MKQADDDWRSEVGTFRADGAGSGFEQLRLGFQKENYRTPGRTDVERFVRRVKNQDLTGQSHLPYAALAQDFTR